MSAFDEAWALVKMPLDLDSIDVSEAPGFLLDDWEPEMHPDGYLAHGGAGEVKTPIAMFIHPKTGEKYPIQMTTPSYSHDFLLEMLFPKGAKHPGMRDGMLSRDQVAMARIGYPDEEPPSEELRDEFRMRYPPGGADVEVHPYVNTSDRRQGMGTALYDLADALGYRVKRSGSLSDEGQGLWESLYSHADVDDPETDLYWMGQKLRNRQAMKDVA
tara:strand:+ start:3686 stop:4330 length:645 start_codon:yes stop_codon:yes gene_type:complete